MNVASIDTYAFVKRLTSSGMPEAQAETVTAMVRQVQDTAFSDLATKADLKDLATKADLKDFVTKADLKEFATKADLKEFATKADLKEFASKADLREFATKADLREFATKADLANTKADILKWVIGMIGGAVLINIMTIVGAVLALVRLLGH